MTPLTAPEIHRLHAAFADGLFRYFWTATGRVCEAEDLVQEFFVKLARGGGSIREARCERAWLFAAAGNLAVDWHRRTTRRAEVPAADDLALLEYGGPADDPDAEFMARELTAAMAKLPDDQRTAAQLRLWEDFSLQQIADLQQVPLQTAASRLRYALRRLRTLLQSVYSELQ